MSQTQLVIFNTNQEKYAINIKNVERIIGYSEITSLPETSEYVLGIINYQDSILPIIDLNKRFYKNAIDYNQDSKILVIQLEGYKIGLLVDFVQEIKSIENDIIEKPSGIIKGVSPEYIQGLIKKEDEIIVLLNVEEIFKGQKQKELIHIKQGR